MRFSVLKKVFLLVCVALLISSICAVGVSQKDRFNMLQTVLCRSGYTAISIQHATGQHAALLIQGTLNNEMRGLFAIDTGATNTQIDSIAAKKLHLIVQKSNVISGGGDDRRHQVFKTRIANLNFNKFTSTDVDAYISDLSSMRVDKQRLSGLIGNTYLQQHQAIIDFKNDFLYLRNNSTSNTLLRLWLTVTGYSQEKIKNTPDGHLIINVAVNGQFADFLLDNGMPFTTLATTLTDKLKLSLLKAREIGGSGGGSMSLFFTKINQLTVGSAPCLSSDVNVMDFKYIQVGAPILGVLGYDWLQSHSAVLDMSQNRLFFRNSNAKNCFNPIKSQT